MSAEEPLGVCTFEASHLALVEERLNEAVNAVLSDATDSNPCAAIGWQLTAGAEPPLVLPPAEKEDSGAWSLESWIQGASVHRAVAAALRRPLGSDVSPQAALTHVKGLKSRAALAALLRSRSMVDSIVDLVWSEVETLQKAGAATSEEIQSKFSGAIEASYSGLDTFFGGLEGVVGSPSPKLFEAMEAEHTQGPESESTDAFVTGNYGIRTTSTAEWVYVVDAKATPEQLQLERWPEESEEKLPDRSRCRQRRTLADIERAAEARNKQLVQAGQPPLIRPELVAANLYTGPMFVKYNAVLRGLRSDSPYLRNTMIQLCCAADTFVQFIGSVPLSALYRPADGALGFSDALRKLNRYTAFMSTTLARDVAMGYAAGDGSRMGIVLEVQQGMVNRGAAISWLSQYPHEREILFGPLTGIEVLRTRVEGSAVVIECAFSINLTALTLEQVLGKRHKLLSDMSEGMLFELRRGLVQDSHLNKSCFFSGMNPIVGRRYEHRRHGHSICESEYTSIEQKSGWRKSDFIGPLEPTLTAEVAEARLQLAEKALRTEILVLDKAWFNEDEHYSAATKAALMVKQQLEVSEPPMLRLFGIQPGGHLELTGVNQPGVVPSTSEGLLQLQARSLGSGTCESGMCDVSEMVRPLEAVQAIDVTKNLQGGADELLATALKMMPPSADSVMELNLFADSSVVYLSQRATRTSLPKRIDLLTRLELVDLSDCSNLEVLPPISSLARLITLRLASCSKLAALPDLHGMIALKTMDCSECSSLAALPLSVGDLVSLQTLGLSGCARLVALPQQLDRCVALQEIDMNGTDPVELPDLYELKERGLVVTGASIWYEGDLHAIGSEDGSRPSTPGVALGLSIRARAIGKALQEISAAWSDRKLAFSEIKKRGPIVLSQGKTAEALNGVEESLARLGSMLASRYVVPLKQEAGEWMRKLSSVYLILEQWLEVQAMWKRLEAVFTSVDIARQLPEEGKRFQDVDEHWVSIMTKANENPLVVAYIYGNDELKQLLPYMLEQLELCQKALSGYLDQKRAAFPRFFFVADATLLEILSQGSNPQAIQPHLPLVFDSVVRVQFDQKNPTLINAIESAEGQTVTLSSPVRAEGNIEQWLDKLLREMQASLNKLVCAAAAECQTMDIEAFTHKYQAQVSLIGMQFKLTHDLEDALSRAKSERGIMQATVKKFLGLLDELVDIIRRGDIELGRVSTWTRKKVESMIVWIIHGKDVCEDLERMHVQDTEDFEWRKQVRFYWRQDLNRAQLSIADADFKYCNEYLGVKKRLVVAPLTDRLFIALSQALNMCLGGMALGAASSGKTATIKDMGLTLGKYVVVTNCSDKMDFRSLGGIYKGLAMSGSLGCFDDFNRIDVEVLSVAAQQMSTVLAAMKANKRSFQYTDGSMINLDMEVVFCATINPGYAGRSEMPENLKSLFRGATSMVPDAEIIAKVKLASFGYMKSGLLAKKIVMLSKSVGVLLSGMDYYDFGLRNVLAVLSTAGTWLRNGTGMSESQLVMRSLRDVYSSKFARDVVPHFLSILADFFPGDTFPRLTAETTEHGDVGKQVTLSIEKFALKPSATWSSKVIQLYETSLVRHSLAVVGPPGSGKSRIVEVLHNAVSAAPAGENQPPLLSQPHRQVRMNAKAISGEQMFGALNLVTKEWTEGIFASLWRKANNDAKSFTWFTYPHRDSNPENLNSVMDDNLVLTLANNERIPMTRPNVTLHFEVEDMRVVSPSTVSKLGVVYVAGEDLGWIPYVECWLAKHVEGNSKQQIFDMLLKYASALLDLVKLECKPKMKVVDIALMTTCSVLIDALIGDRSWSRLQRDAVERVILFALAWSVGGLLEASGRKRVEHLLRYLAANTPAESIFDCCLDESTLGWVTLSSHVSPWRYTGEPIDLGQNLPSLVVPTQELVGYAQLIELSTSQRRRGVLRGVILIGGHGVSKSWTALHVLAKANPEVWATKKMAFCDLTSANMVQRQIEACIERRQGKSFGATGGRKMYVLLDDLSSPRIEMYGAQPPLELLRQLVEHGGFYNLDKPGEWKRMLDLVILGTMRHPGGGKNDIPDRAKRHFHVMNVTLPSTASIEQIFGVMTEAKFADSHVPEVVALSRSLVSMTIAIWDRVKAKLLPTPAKFHYFFNLRDLSRVFQGIFTADVRQTLTSPFHDLPPSTTLLALWKHECERVFSDRLVDATDKGWYAKEVITVLEGFSSQLGADTIKALKQKEATGGRIYFVDFMRPPGEDPATGATLSPPKIYEPVYFDDVRSMAKGYLSKFNEAFKLLRMELVFFQDAIEHLCSITRLLGTPRGHVLNVGVAGSGRKSLTLLAAFIANCECFQITLTKTYDANNLLEDFKPLYRRAGVQAKPTVFMCTDTQILSERFVEVFNVFLNTGELPNLFPGDELDAIVAECRETYQQIYKNSEPTVDTIWTFFIDRVRTNLHVSLCFSPIGKAFRARSRDFPGLHNHCTVIWQQPWPEEALASTAKYFLDDVELGDPATKAALINFMPHAFLTVVSASEEYAAQHLRLVYTTPKLFVEMIVLFRKMLAERRDKIGASITKLSNGVRKLEITSSNLPMHEKEVEKLLATMTTRWEQSIITLKESLKTLVGNMAMASAFIAYLGPFCSSFREKLQREFYRDLVDRRLLCTEDQRISLFLVEPSTIGDWKLDGLPTDELSIQNGVIVTHAQKWPLMIDPQWQGLGWIKAREAKNGIKSTQLTNKHFRNHLEDAMALGTPLIIENVESDIDQVLHPLLKKEIQRSGDGAHVKLYGRACPYKETFALFMCSKLANPSYQPETYARLTVINFTVTMSGLEQQLLGRVVVMERAELEDWRNRQVEAANANQKTLKRLEDDLLQRLASSTGNLLDDAALIEVLQQTQCTKIEVAEKLANAEKTDERIDTAREEYRPVATRGALLYFLIVDMVSINNMYTVSLQQFLELYDVSVNNSEKVPIAAERAVNIIEYMTNHVTRYMQRGLFERHKKIWTLMLTMKIEQVADRLSVAYVGNLLKGGSVLDAKSEKAAPGSWIPEVVWLNILALSRTVQALRDLPDNVERFNDAWRAWYEHDAPETQPFPDYNERLNQFEAMLLVRAIREDRALLSIDTYIAHTIGKDYNITTPLNLLALHNEASAYVPMITLLSSGSDPISKIQDLALREKKQLHSISLGQGQEPAALKLLDRSIRYVGDTSGGSNDMALAAPCTVIQSAPLRGVHSIALQYFDIKSPATEAAKEGFIDMYSVEETTAAIQAGNLPNPPEKWEPWWYVAVVALSVADIAECKGAVDSKKAALAKQGRVFWRRIDSLYPQAEDCKRSLQRIVSGDGFRDYTGIARASHGDPSGDDDTSGDGDTSYGDWILLQNCHLCRSFIVKIEEWLINLPKLEETTPGSVMPEFRLWITSEPYPTFPIGLLQSSIKFTNEAPAGIMAGLKNSYQQQSGVNQDLLNSVPDPKWRTMLYALCFLHTIVQERRKFGVIGFAIPYEFSQADLSACINFLRNYLTDMAEKKRPVDWACVNYMVCEVQYGGKITDVWDRRLFTTYGKMWLNEGCLSAAFHFLPGNDRYTIPPSTGDIDQFRHHIDRLPLVDDPALFGLHANDDVVFRTKKTGDTLHTILNIQSREGGGGGIGLTREDLAIKIVDRTVDDLHSKWPPEYDDAETIRALLESKKLGGLNKPLNICLRQEVDQLQKAISVLRQRCRKLKLAIGGGIEMSPELTGFLSNPETLFDMDRNDRGSFERISWHAAQLTSWLRNGRPISFWLGGFFRPLAFLAASQQEICRAHSGESWELDQCVTKFEVLPHDEQSLERGPAEGVYVHGIFLEGARWDTQRGVLADPEPRVLVAPLPVLHISATRSEAGASSQAQSYVAPMYSAPDIRHGFRSTVGTITNFVTSVGLPCDEAPDKWVLRGVCLRTRIGRAPP